MGQNRPRSFYNKSGCPDPTAYRAIRNIECRHSIELSVLMKILNKVCKKYGYSLVDHITFKDLKTGEITKRYYVRERKKK